MSVHFARPSRLANNEPQARRRRLSEKHQRDHEGQTEALGLLLEKGTGLRRVRTGEVHREMPGGRVDRVSADSVCPLPLLMTSALRPKADISRTYPMLATAKDCLRLRAYLIGPTIGTEWTGCPLSAWTRGDARSQA